MAKRLRTEEYESFVESGLSPNADREEADLGSAVERDLQLAQNLEDQLKSGGKSGSKIHREAGSPPRSDEAETIDAQAVNKARKEKLKNDGRKQDQRLRKIVAYWAIALVALQLVISNVYFGIYLIWQPKTLDPTLMIAWMSASVVEIIGILWVVARSLFPYRDKGRRADKKSTKSTAGRWDWHVE
ncbi:hypothetical protein [Brachybacterium sp. EE-P12]|uniref:hypothetical protein n=1 Tax=Brachybacterium sp. EE-P12 TaxID=2306299 RepID=UPI0013DE795E|nr:hypothetical protein [Brachybacterium sp. EE-P12]